MIEEEVKKHETKPNQNGIRNVGTIKGQPKAHPCAWRPSMSQHNQLNWSDFLLCIGMELAFHKNGERPMQEQMIAEKIQSLGGKL